MAQRIYRLTVDPARAHAAKADIRVQAWLDGKRGLHDIATLDRPSLMAWLRGGGGDNMRAENVVAVTLGHETHEVTRG